MPRGMNHKTKLYRLGQIMLRETDEDHKLTVKEIRERLEEFGITVDRKTVYDDLEELHILGLTIDREQEGRQFYYYVSGKQFEIAELKLLVDAIQASRFITARKSNELIRKLTSFASRHEARQLDRQVYVAGRVKTMNESIYYNVDAIHRAISRNRRITFEYLTWNLNKKLVPRRSGRYEASPWGLTWTDENYYLVAYDSDAGIIKHYRVDKMKGICDIEKKRDGQEHFRQFDMAAYANMNFSMYGGKEESVRLRFENDMATVMIDRFGKDITIHPADGWHSDVIVKVAVSEQFFGWVFGLGGRVWIAGPDSVVLQYRALIKEQSRIMDGGG